MRAQSCLKNKSQKVRFYIFYVDSYYTQAVKNERTVDKPQLPVQSISCKELQRYKHLRAFPIVEYTDAQPQVLIVVDNHILMTSLEVAKGHEGEPVAIQSKLGWTVIDDNENYDFLEH